jgi:hypothetical protein
MCQNVNTSKRPEYLKFIEIYSQIPRPLKGLTQLKSKSFFILPLQNFDIPHES